MKKIILLSMLIITSLASNAQVYTYGGFGTTNMKISADFQAGYRWKNNITTSVGLTTIPDSEHPVFFSAQAGYVIKETVVVFGGYARAMRSIGNKALNKNSFQAGAQWHFMYAVDRRGMRGTMYVQPMYTYPKYASVHLGLTLNLINREQ